MIIAETTHNTWLVITPSGRIDAHSAPQLEQAVREKITQGIHLAIDLSEVGYLSSAGLRVLLVTLKLVNEKEGKLTLVSPQPSVSRVLEFSGFLAIMTVVDNLDSA